MNWVWLHRKVEVGGHAAAEGAEAVGLDFSRIFCDFGRGNSPFPLNLCVAFFVAIYGSQFTVIHIFA